METDQPNCKADGCDRKLRASTNKTGYCTRHFYLSKLKNVEKLVTIAPGRVSRAGKRNEKRNHDPAKTKGSRAARAAARVALMVDEIQLDAFITGRPLEDKARMVNALLSGAI